MPTLFKHQPERPEQLQAAQPAFSLWLQQDIPTSIRKSLWIQKHPEQMQWIICHVPRSPDGKPWKSQPVFTEHNWPQVDQKRGCAPQLHPHEGGKIRRHVQFTEQVVREGRPRFPIFKSSAVLLSKTQQALPLARCAIFLNN